MTTHSTTVDLALSRDVPDSLIRTSIAAAAGRPLEVDIARPGVQLKYEVTMAWVEVTPTNDPAWPVVLNCLNIPGFRSEHEADNFSLQLSERLGSTGNTSVLCFSWSEAAVPETRELDPHDPFWALEMIGGSWFLVSTCDTKLMGPYITMSGAEIPGDSTVRVIRPVAVALSALHHAEKSVGVQPSPRDHVASGQGDNGWSPAPPGFESLSANASSPGPEAIRFHPRWTPTVVEEETMAEGTWWYDDEIPYQIVLWRLRYNYGSDDLQVLKRVLPAELHEELDEAVNPCGDVYFWRFDGPADKSNSPSLSSLQQAKQHIKTYGRVDVQWATPSTP